MQLLGFLLPFIGLSFGFVPMIEQQWPTTGRRIKSIERADKSISTVRIGRQSNDSCVDICSWRFKSAPVWDDNSNDCQCRCVASECQKRCKDTGFMNGGTCRTDVGCSCSKFEYDENADVHPIPTDQSCELHRWPLTPFTSSRIDYLQHVRLKYVCNQLCQSYHYQSTSGECFRFDSYIAGTQQRSRFNCVCRCKADDCQRHCKKIIGRESGRCQAERGCVCGDRKAKYAYKKLWYRRVARRYY